MITSISAMNSGSVSAAADAPGKKRARYTTIACNECKRRKIKCNGGKPCERCGNQSLECVYATNDFQDTDEYRHLTTRVSALENQLSSLLSVISQLRQDVADLRSTPSNELHSSPPTSRLAPGNGDGDVDGSAAMDVDMSRAGRIEFVAHQRESPITRHADPVLAISRRACVRLLSVYSQNFHPVFPFMRTEQVMWHMYRVSELRERVSSPGFAGPMPPADHFSGDVGVTMLKMVMAVAAKAEAGLMPEPALATAFYANVQEVYSKTGFPPSPPENVDDEAGGPEEGPRDLRAPSRRQEWVENSIRLQLIQALWCFQHGEDEQALAEVTLARRRYEAELKTLQGSGLVGAGAAVEDDVDAIPDAVPLADSLYSMYWLFVVMLKPPLRWDMTLDSGPYVDIRDNVVQDEENTLAGPLLEYAKITGLIVYGFEVATSSSTSLSDAAFSLLANTKHPFTRADAVNHVHRWQTTFPDGLRSLATRRPGLLSSKTARERVVHSAVYLLANALRLVACAYKSNAPIYSAYEGPIDELVQSTQWAQDSVTVLWNVHLTVTTWPPLRMLWNVFLVQAAEWLFGWAKSGNINWEEPTKAALEKALALLESYATDSDRAGAVLAKLRAHRHMGLLGDPL